MIVIDSSVAVCWSMPDESSPIADAALEVARRGIVVPALFFYELRNTLIVNERRGRIDLVWTEQTLAMISGLPIVVDFEPNDAALLALTRRHSLSIYDASYLELAVRLRGSLASLDRKLMRAAELEGVGFG